MKHSNVIMTRNAAELAEVLGLTPSDAVEIEIRSDLNDKIIEVAKKKRLTHEQVATLAHTSRTRITAIMNRNIGELSTDLLLRVLGSLGVHASIHFKKAA